MLYRSDLTKRLTKWAIELSEFEVPFEVKKELKAQLFVDFFREMTVTLGRTWVVFIDESSNIHGSGTRFIMENNGGLMIKFSLRFKFPNTNNQAEYEIVMPGIPLAEEVGHNSSN